MFTWATHTSVASVVLVNSGGFGREVTYLLRLLAIPGVVEHGLFIGLASMAILGTDDGVRTIGG